MDILGSVIEINKRLAEIANLTGQMAHEEVANSANPEFVQLMNEQARLIEDQFQLLNEEIRSRLP